ncbi:TetR/AcrR family transcriptional regulator [Streptomyces sp. HNM0574]|uniref:TetR/AcrR family transcriptional regulator n=1 Tax=Streptomyces sp. HNM0574 TaxID=2714954 RepID=UPI00146DB65A|nr:TetR/AcrR family transcriptional regulator [Streptomyces sp. HNM0574]NLU68390.1 TetR/AcrR family transcriptional regulator [Streptomyces sp. HNM0574]
MEHEAVDPRDLTPRARRILDVASGLFYNGGIHAVGVDTIAAESGVTKRTLYNNFGSKDALVATYLKNRHSTWWQGLEERLAAAEAPRALTVFDVYAEDARTITRGCGFLNAAAELPVEHPAYAIIRYHKQSVEERLGELIAEDRPDAENPARLARHLFLLLEGAFAHHGIHGKELLTEAREIARELLT